MVPYGLVFRAKENGRRKDALKTLRHTAAIAAIIGKSEEIQDLCGTVKTDGSALLPQSECGHPDGNKLVLAKRQAEIGMANNLKKEFPVAALVDKLIFGRRS